MGVEIARGPGNEPTKCEKISKDKLISMLPEGTKLTANWATWFNRPRHRTVVKATVSRILFDGDHRLDFEKGDKFFLHEAGFSVVTEDGLTMSYLFGHV